MKFFLRAPLVAFEVRKQVRISNVGFVGGVVKFLVEHHLQLFNKGLLSTHQLGKPHYVVRNIESVVPSVAFVKARTRFEVLALLGIEGRIKLAVGQNGPKCAVLFAIIVAITQRTVVEQSRIGFLSQGGGQPREGVVGDIIL